MAPVPQGYSFKVSPVGSYSLPAEIVFCVGSGTRQIRLTQSVEAAEPPHYTGLRYFLRQLIAMSEEISGQTVPCWVVACDASHKVIPSTKSMVQQISIPVTDPH